MTTIEIITVIVSTDTKAVVVGGIVAVLEAIMSHQTIIVVVVVVVATVGVKNLILETFDQVHRVAASK